MVRAKRNSEHAGSTSSTRIRTPRRASTRGIYDYLHMVHGKVEEGEATNMDTDNNADSRSSRNFRNVQLSEFTCKQLVEVCRQRGVSNFSQLDKRSLVSLVNTELLKKNEAVFDTKRSIVAWPRQSINEIDAVSLMDITNRNPIYTFDIEAPGVGGVRSVHRFDPVSFVEMVLSTGDTFNPYTRVPLTEAQLFRLEHVYASCLRGHPSCPVSKVGMLAMRSHDMLTRELGPVPTRSDLGLDVEPGEDPEPMPGPVMGYAPWLVSEPLCILARRNKLAVEDARQQAETRALMSHWVVSALDCLLMFLEPSARDISALSQGSATRMFDMALNVYVPLVMESLEELFESACSEFRTVLPMVLERLLQARRELPHIVLRTMAAWSLAIIIDEVLRLSMRSLTQTPGNADIRWIYENVRAMEPDHSTAALVCMSVEMNIMCGLSMNGGLLMS